MTRDKALALVREHTKNENLVRHMLAVEAVMRALAHRLSGDPEVWGIAGLLHDADYEETKDDDPHINHTKKLLEWLEGKGVGQEIEEAILAHGWNYVDGNPQPKTEMEWALYTCDELTGLIVAVALVKPDKKLSSVTVDSVLKKWREKSFAAGANREQIKMCETKLNIPLTEFVGIALAAMQGINQEIGL